MTKCSFCGFEQNPVFGLHLINNDGTISYFCSSKCRKNNLHLKRDKKKLKWTEAHGIAYAALQAKEQRAQVKAAEKKAETKAK